MVCPDGGQGDDWCDRGGCQGSGGKEENDPLCRPLKKAAKRRSVAATCTTFKVKLAKQVIHEQWLTDFIMTD